MRRFLLATVAMLGGSLGVAQAQVLMNTPPGPAGTLNPNLFSQPFTATPGTTPAGPGSVSVRLNARFNFFSGVLSDSGRNPGRITTTAGAAPVASNTKLAGYTMGEYTRLYPGFDGIAGNGLKYGAYMEIRQENAAAPGNGVGGSISSSNRSRGALYFRREMAYVGTDKLGTVRFGSGDGPSSLFITGTMENFDESAWDGEFPVLFSANATPTWPFLDSGAWYTTTKAVYVSPQFYGFDFGVGFEPGTGNVNLNGNCPFANTVSTGITGPVTSGGAAGCDATSSSSNTSEIRRRRNLIDAQLRYRGSVGPVGVVLQAGYLTSGRVSDDGTPQSAVQYNNTNLGDFGAQFTYGGLLVGGHLLYGAVNGQGQLLPKGETPSLAWIGGASYAMGPLIVGASYFDYRSAGAQNSATPGNMGRSDEYGVDVGGTFTFAPGMNIFLSYLYGHRSEGGVDLLTGVGSTAAVKTITHNNVQSSGLMFGTQFRW